MIISIGYETYDSGDAGYEKTQDREELHREDIEDEFDDAEMLMLSDDAELLMLRC